MNIKTIKYQNLSLLVVVFILIATLIFPIPVQAAASPIRITELMYDPSGTGDREFIEIYNGSDVTANLGGMSMVGVLFTFPAGATLAPGSYGVVVRNQAVFSANNSGVKVFGQYGGKLRGSGETVSIIKSGTTYSSVTYTYGGAWPQTPKNGGPSLSLIRSTANEGQAGCWAPSASDGGTPGRINTINRSWNGGACGDVAYPKTAAPSPSPTQSNSGQASGQSPQSSNQTGSSQQNSGTSQTNTANTGSAEQQADQTAQAEAKIAEQVSKEVAQDAIKRQQDSRNSTILAITSGVALLVVIGSILIYTTVKRKIKFNQLIKKTGGTKPKKRYAKKKK